MNPGALLALSVTDAASYDDAVVNGQGDGVRSVMRAKFVGCGLKMSVDGGFGDAENFCSHPGGLTFRRPG
jgi:hypothetical protein